MLMAVYDESGSYLSYVTLVCSRIEITGYKGRCQNRSTKECGFPHSISSQDRVEFPTCDFQLERLFSEVCREFCTQKRKKTRTGKLRARAITTYFVLKRCPSVSTIGTSLSSSFFNSVIPSTISLPQIMHETTVAVAVCKESYHKRSSVAVVPQQDVS